MKTKKYSTAPLDAKDRIKNKPVVCYPIDNLKLNPAKKVGTSNEVVSKVQLSFNHRSAIIILPKKYLTNVLEVL